MSQMPPWLSSLRTTDSRLLRDKATRCEEVKHKPPVSEKSEPALLPSNF